MVSYIWQNISSSFWSATAACGVWSVQSPATPPPRAGPELLAPVHKQGSHRGLRDAGVTDTVLQMNHSRPIPQGSVLKGINTQSHHPQRMHSVPIKQGHSADDSVHSQQEQTHKQMNKADAEPK